MQEFPHHYHATATVRESFVDLAAPGLETLETAGPAEFDGPGDKWSPETMLTGTMANCFILTFKAVARASKFDWLDITCHADSVLHRVDRVTRFTDATLTVALTIADPAKRDQAERILRKSEENCLITNSLTTNVTLVTEVIVGQLAAS